IDVIHAQLRPFNCAAYDSWCIYFHNQLKSQCKDVFFTIMELAICKTELPTTKFMLPSSGTASFYDTNSHNSEATAHFNDILNFQTNYLFNKTSSNNITNSNNLLDHTLDLNAINTTTNIINNTQLNNNCNNCNTTTATIGVGSSNSGSIGTASSSMRLKKNRKVTFLSNLIETKNIFIKEEPIDGNKDLPPPICSLSDISDHEASLGESIFLF
uniref:Uncharacterized protein n=1 Tax=Glossina morsitans morsitans TaxID=37546 RepID=A0A1B0GAI3_GLOMM